MTTNNEKPNNSAEPTLPVIQVFTDSSWCNDGTPNHDWQGWREFDGGRGGERVCAKCGMGAMHHSLMTGP